MNSAVVVDTDVVSLLFKEHPSAERYLEAMDGKLCVLSFMSLAELKRWPLAKNWGAFRRARLRRFLRQFAVCYCNEELCEVWAEVREAADASGRPIDVADAWIAAAAVYLGVPLLTHNSRHYAGVDTLQILPPA